MRQFYLYILASRSRVLYIGVTNDLDRRLRQHLEGRASEFTRAYRVYRLVYAESYRYVRDAIAREKQIKGWKRWRKLRLIEEANPGWRDVWGDPGSDGDQ